MAREADILKLVEIIDATLPGPGNLTSLNKLYSTKLLVKGLNQSCCDVNFWS